nr:hypothetical protein CFP56_13371 [Quercus suber]
MVAASSKGRIAPCLDIAVVDTPGRLRMVFQLYGRSYPVFDQCQSSFVPAWNHLNMGVDEVCQLWKFDELTPDKRTSACPVCWYDFISNVLPVTDVPFTDMRLRMDPGIQERAFTRQDCRVGVVLCAGRGRWLVIYIYRLGHLVLKFGAFSFEACLGSSSTQLALGLVLSVVLI